MKTTRIAFFSSTLPELGFEISWQPTYQQAVDSPAIYSGFRGASGNTMILSEIALPVDELDISSSGAFGGVFGEVDKMFVQDTDVNGIIQPNLSVLNASNTLVTSVGKVSSELRVENNGLTTKQVDSITSQYLIYDDDGLPIAGEPIVIENLNNAPANLTDAGLIDNAGGHVYEDDAAYLKLQTDSAVATSFVFFLNAGPAISWWQDGVEVASGVNNFTFQFTNNSVKHLRIGGADVADGKYMIVASKSLVGTFDMSSMTSAAFRIDFSNNPNLTEVILPNTSGIFDQLMAFNTGITSLRLDKLPGLIGSINIQIRLGDCPNLDTDSVVRNILAIDDGIPTGRQFWTNGTTPNMSASLKLEMQANNWTIVE